ncbi:MAG: sulfite exporter TauE/SafE family protein [Xanthobacteraceae bacterium]
MLDIFTAAIADRRFALALAIAALSGLVRGFSGFGSALIYMPLVAAVYEPRTAAVTLLLIDFVASSPFAIGQVSNCNWREVLPIFVAAAIAIPFGTAALKVVDPTVLRWFMALLVLCLLVVLASGWRYHRPPRLAVTLGVGLFSGFGGGAVQIAGPSVILYWLATRNDPVTVRANLMVYFLLTGAALCVSYLLQGLFTGEAAALSLLFGIPFVIGTALGAHIFRGSSERLYRQVAYLVIAISALVSLPLFDLLVR